MKISIIVPVYNCEAFLKTCVESILGQSFRNLELYLVDDGSADSCPQICDDFQKQDPRVCVIHKQNGGVSSARNAGLQACTGDYVTFVDADDWLDTDACEKMARQASDGKRLYLWKMYRYTDGISQEQRDIAGWNSLEELTADIISSPRQQNPYLRACWAKLYSREWIQNCAFPEKQYIGEDACFLIDCIKALEDICQVSVINDAWYHYRIVPGSAVRRYKPDLLEQNIQQLRYFEKTICQTGQENSVAVSTAMTVFCWTALMDLYKNAVRSGKKLEDCHAWEAVCRQYLKNPGAQGDKMGKFQHLIWQLYGKTNLKWILYLIGLRDRIKA